MVEVRNNGVPLIEQAPKAAITQAFVTLADALAKADEKAKEPEAAAVGAAAKKGGSWLGFLKGK
jgi:pilus assembly protein CpaE